MNWIQVSADLPAEGELMLCYSQVYGGYFLAKWTAARGWLDQDNEDIKIITHWCNLKLPLDYEITNKVDEEVAKRYDMKVVKTLFN